MHAGHPIERGRWADPRVVRSTGVTQGLHVRTILVDPCAYLISSADGPVAGDQDIDVARHALEQPQRGEVVLDRVSGVVQVKHRNQGINTPAWPCTTTALLWQNSLWWISTPSATCLSMVAPPLVV